ncbi:hypothetical protein AAMO2058_001117300 [Amorphochlora amoebiformis]
MTPLHVARPSGVRACDKSWMGWRVWGGIGVILLFFQDPNRPRPCRMDAPNITLRKIATPEDIETLRRIDVDTFPIKYGKRHYDTVLNDLNWNNHSRIAFVGDDPVGAFVCAKDKHGKDKKRGMTRKGFRLWMQTFAVLRSQRGRGVGKALLDEVREMALGDPNITDILIYQPPSEMLMLNFYYTMGFRSVCMRENYYERYKKIIQPPHAILLCYKVRTNAGGPADCELTRKLQEAYRAGNETYTEENTTYVLRTNASGRGVEEILQLWNESGHHDYSDFAIDIIKREKDISFLTDQRDFSSRTQTQESEEEGSDIKPRELIDKVMDLEDDSEYSSSENPNLQEW